MATFAVVLERFNRWDWSRDMRDQDRWDEHAAFMDEQADAGFVLLAGPLGDLHRVLLIIDATGEAAIRARLADDPWAGTHLRVESISPWNVVLRAPPTSCVSAVALDRLAPP